MVDHWVVFNLEGELTETDLPAAYSPPIPQPLSPIDGERGELLNEIGTNERHPLYELLDTLGTLLHAYEEKHHPIPENNGADMLRYFMEEYGLAQSDLPEVGSQGVVSEILNGMRVLNIRQIRALARRSHVSPAVFI